MLSRLKRLAERKGFKFSPVGNFINGRFQTRPDILSVSYKGIHIMTCPKRIYGFPNASHRDLIGGQHPDYFELENRLLSWERTIKTTDWLSKQHELYKKISN